MTKVCPLCGKTYENDTRRCPLLHCPNCDKTALIKTHLDPEVGFKIFIILFSISMGWIFVLIFYYTPITSDLIVKFWWVILAIYSLAYALVAVALVAYYGPYKCDDCGAKFLLPKKNIILAEEYFEKKCKSCGSMMPNNAKFCGKCGAKIRE